MDTEAFSLPQQVGPGFWFVLHTVAAHANTPEKKKSCIDLILLLCESFRCQKCKQHFRRFIETHPFERYLDITDSQGANIGLFRWTWELHNAVNRLLGKSQPGLDVSFNYFLNKEIGVCDNCPENVTLAPTITAPSDNFPTSPTLEDVASGLFPSPVPKGESSIMLRRDIFDRRVGQSSTESVPLRLVARR